MARRALLIANGTYDEAGISQLLSPVSDARQLRDLLARPDVGEFDVDPHFDKGAHALRLAISKFFKASKPGDHQIVHISGHGFKDEHGKLYFGARDTELDCLDATAISARFLHERATESLASQTIIFIDTCYSGAYLHGQMKAGANVIAKDDFVIDDSNGVVIVTASSSTQLGWELANQDKTQSLFTKHMIEGIRTGAADSAASGKITLNNLFSHIEGKIRPSQQPKTFNFGLGSNVTVTLNPCKPAKSLSALLTAKLESGDFLQRCDGCRDLYDLVAQDSEWTDIAVAHLEDLTTDPDERVRRRAERELASVYDLVSPKPFAKVAAPKLPERKPTPSGTIVEPWTRSSASDSSNHSSIPSPKPKHDYTLGVIFVIITFCIIILLAISGQRSNQSNFDSSIYGNAAADAAMNTADAMAPADEAMNAATNAAEGAMMEAAPAAEGAVTEGSMSDFLEEKK